MGKRINDHIKRVGSKSHDLMKFGLCKLLGERYRGRPDCGKLAAEIANYLFDGDVFWPCSASEFAKEHQAEIEAQSRKLNTDDFTCEALTNAVYNWCYGNYIAAGNSLGWFFHPFLGYFRALQKSDFQAENAFVKKLPSESWLPLLRLRTFGLLRPLPYTPDSKYTLAVVENFYRVATTMRSANPTPAASKVLATGTVAEAESPRHEMDQNEFSEAVKKRSEEFMDNPDSGKWERPYDVHYYVSREGSRTRVFDLYDDGLGFTSIGESVVDNWVPSGFSQKTNCGSYVHFNFGVVPISPPDKAMEWFAQDRSLTAVTKLGNVKTLREMTAFQANVVKQLTDTPK